MSIKPLGLRLILCLSLLPCAVDAQPLRTGAELFMDYCTQCHGDDGRGYGVLMDKRPDALPDLRTLAKRNHGVFPVKRVFKIVSGGVDIEMHDVPNMPAWRDVFRFREDQGDATAREHTLNLVQYLTQIQDPVTR
ncbi:MAG: c-type cytochrome [Pseudomonadota bacterium]